MTLNSKNALISLEALVPNQPVRVEDGSGRQICLILSDGTVRAYVDECPHRGHPISNGTCLDNGRLRCALHGWEFRVDDGSAVSPVSPFRLTTAAVRVLDGVVELAV